MEVCATKYMGQAYKANTNFQQFQDFFYLLSAVYFQASRVGRNPPAKDMYIQPTGSQYRVRISISEYSGAPHEFFNIKISLKS